MEKSKTFDGDVPLHLAGLLKQDAALENAPPAPLAKEDWNPPFCGKIDMRIAQDGTWFYNQSPILRPAMVKLFASILRKERESYFLVTPVEKVEIEVEDVPFIAVEMNKENDPETGGPLLTFRTNVDDTVTAGQEHPLRFINAEEEGFKPYILVRKELFARLSRTLAQELAGLGEIEDYHGKAWFGVRSGSVFFPIALCEAVEAKDIKAEDRDIG